MHDDDFYEVIDLVKDDLVSDHSTLTIYEPIVGRVMDHYKTQPKQVLRTNGWLSSGKEAHFVATPIGRQTRSHHSTVPPGDASQPLVTIIVGNGNKTGGHHTNNLCGVITMMEVRALVDPTFSKGVYGYIHYYSEF